MKDRLFQRIAMLVAGFLAAGVILLSQSFYQSTVHSKSPKAATEQSSEHERQALISAPSDLLPGTSSVQVLENPLVLLSILDLPEVKLGFAPVRTKFTLTFFRTLFRTIIASKAP